MARQARPGSSTGSSVVRFGPLEPAEVVADPGATDFQSVVVGVGRLMARQVGEDGRVGLVLAVQRVGGDQITSQGSSPEGPRRVSGSVELGERQRA